MPHVDLQPDEIQHRPSLVEPLPTGAAVRQTHPLAVTILDRDLRICRPKGIHTLIEVIKELGIERVKALGIISSGIPFVADIDYDGVQQTPVGKYYIAGNSSTSTKVEQIKEIARGLNIELKVEQLNVR